MRLVLPEMKPARVPGQLVPYDQPLTLVYEINDVCKLNNHKSKSVPLPERVQERVYIKKIKI